VPEAVFAVPGDLATPTGGYAYDRQLIAHLPAAGVAIRHLALPGSFPDPTPADLAVTERCLAAVAAESVLVIDGLAFGALPAWLVGRIRPPIVVLVHHPLGLETGSSAARRDALLASERLALAHAAAAIVTSPHTGRLLCELFEFDRDRITVAEPGVEPAPRAQGSGTPPLILAVGAVSPRKAYGDLIAALASLRAQPWRATIVGSLDRAPAEAWRLRRQIADAGFGGRITLAGAVDVETLAKHYDAADLFVHASHFEGYGMVLAEAMARGIAIVTTRAGAAAETVPDDAAVKIAPGDIGGLADAIAMLIGDRALRTRMADAAWRAGQSLPRWPDTARRIAETIKRVARR